jgi:biotin-(acetyl-CoA carboxylase) ligase
VKIGGVLVEMDSESTNLRIGVGINQLNDTIGNLKIKGWKEITPELRLEKLFPIIDAELSTLFEKHPLLENKIDKDGIKSESWRSLSKLISRGYTIETEKGNSRITKLNTNGELSVVLNNYEENINNIESIRWSF